MQPYIYWALLGMAGYSFTTLFTKLAERSSEEEDGRTGHLPLALLAAWDRAALPAGERALLELHLAACAACRSSSLLYSA